MHGQPGPESTGAVLLKHIPRDSTAEKLEKEFRMCQEWIILYTIPHRKGGVAA
jgi:hypothetical protein